MSEKVYFTVFPESDYLRIVRTGIGSRTGHGYRDVMWFDIIRANELKLHVWTWALRDGIGDDVLKADVVHVRVSKG